MSARVFTVRCVWPCGTDEEMDLPARSAAEARKAAEALLADPHEYQPGGKVAAVGPFAGITVYRW